MKFIALLLATAAAIACGLGLGSIPGLNENLHWNVWIVLPVGGALIGGLLGSIQFGVVRLLHQPVGGAFAALLAVGCMAGYAATEFGIYHSIEVEVTETEDVAPGLYPLSELISFSDYLDYSLAASSYGRGSSDETTVDYGRTGTMLTWAVDLVGAFLVSFGILLGFAGHFPYCDSCRRYKKPNQDVTMVLSHDSATETLEAIHSRVAEVDYAGLITTLIEGGKQVEPPKAEQAIRIKAEERVCPSCNAATVKGTVEAKGDKGWNEVSELAFKLSSVAGETARLTPS